MLSRNTSRGFARRTIKDLEYIQKVAYDYRKGGPPGNQPEDSPVHEVTQIINSFLGLVVFPVEESKKAKNHPTALEKAMDKKQLQSLNEVDWSQWEFDMGIQSTTLGNLVEHLRNAIVHRRVTYSGNIDALDPAQVIVTFEDAWTTHGNPYWRVRVGASQLHLFCKAFGEFLEYQSQNQ